MGNGPGFRAAIPQGMAKANAHNSCSPPGRVEWPAVQRRMTIGVGQGCRAPGNEGVGAVSATPLPPSPAAARKKMKEGGVRCGTPGLRASDADGIGISSVPPGVGLCGTFGTGADAMTGVYDLCDLSAPPMALIVCRPERSEGPRASTESAVEPSGPSLKAHVECADSGRQMLESRTRTTHGVEGRGGAVGAVSATPLPPSRSP